MDDMLVKMASQVDQLMTLDIWHKFGPRDTLRRMYEAARALFDEGQEPLSLMTARRLAAAVKPGNVVFLTAGMIVPPWQIIESDGPPGVAALARAVTKALEGIPVVLVEEAWRSVLAAVCRAAGLNLVPAERVQGAPPPQLAIVDFPIEPQVAQSRAQELLDTFSPAALIAVERAGCNEKGEYHSGRGHNVSAVTGKFHCLFQEAAARGILTIGIGDHGGELGLGRIRETVKQHVLTGARCLCPCGGGIADSVDADVPVIAGISNWGAYGVAAVLAALMDRSTALHTGQVERRMLAACADAGAVEGFSGEPTPGVDGMSPDSSAAFVELLRIVVERGLDRSFVAYV